MSSYIKSIAVPKEHGGWGFIGEAALVGLALAPSLSGVFILMATVLLFLLSQPLKIYVQDQLQKRRLERTALAEKLMLGYGLSAAVTIIVLIWINGNNFRSILALFLLTSSIQFIYSIQKKEKEFIAEIFGAAAIGLTSSMILVSAGWPLKEAFIIWGVLSVRTVTSIFFVRHKLKKKNEWFNSAFSVGAVQAIGFLVLAILVYQGYSYWGIMIGYFVLAARAFYGVSRLAKTTRAKTIGIREIFYGLFYCLCIIFSYKINL